jgi:hypothetical protein
MPYLYCAAHGREHENRVIGQQEDYRQEGESVLIVHGTLTGGAQRCDKCNATLRRGDAATTLSAFSRHVVDGMGDYDFASERRYFDMAKASAAVYGTPWPDAARLRPPGHSGY